MYKKWVSSTTASSIITFDELYEGCDDGSRRERRQHASPRSDYMQSVCEARI